MKSGKPAPSQLLEDAFRRILGFEDRQPPDAVFLETLRRTLGNTEAAYDRLEPLESPDFSRGFKKPSSTGGTYTQKIPLHPHRPNAPETYLVQFVGGPLNATQRFIPHSAHPLNEFDGRIYRLMEHFVNPKYPPNPSDRPQFSIYDYAITLVPQSETSNFLEETTQLVIALYR